MDIAAIKDSVMSVAPPCGGERGDSWRCVKVKGDYIRREKKEW